jgi:hypothetical protein
MDKLTQKYFTMVRLGPSDATPSYNPIIKWKNMPMEGVVLEEAYQVFGESDFAVLFEANTNENASLCW